MTQIVSLPELIQYCPAAYETTPVTLPGVVFTAFAAANAPVAETEIRTAKQSLRNIMALTGKVDARL